MFHGPEGPQVIVCEAHAGATLGAFAKTAFRELLGRANNSQHLAPRHAARNDSYAVNGAYADKRTTLRAGDTVAMLRLATPPTIAAQPAAASSHRARMVYSAADSTPLHDVESAGALAFDAYYRSQTLSAASDWDASLALMQRPMPLCVRANLSTCGHAEAVEALRAAFRRRECELAPLGWVPGAWQLRLDAAPSGVSAGDAEVTSLLLGAQCCGQLAQQEAAARDQEAMLRDERESRARAEAELRDAEAEQEASGSGERRSVAL